MKELDMEQMKLVTGGGTVSPKPDTKENTPVRDSSETFEYHKCGSCNKVTIFRIYFNKRGACTECGWILQQ